VLVVHPYAWIALRAVIGFSFAGIFAVIESWLSSKATRATRARIFAIYRTVDMLAVSAAQYLLPVFGAQGFQIFAVMAVFTCLSLLPVALADRSNPEAPQEAHFDLKAVWIISPIACSACVTIGLTNTSFRLIGPLFATEIGLSLAQVATFISAAVLGAAAFQFPLGVLSDRLDRRWVLIGATTAAALTAFALAVAPYQSPLLAYLNAFLFGASTLPLYSLSAAHANDRAKPGQYVVVAAGLSFFFSVGAMFGPPVSSTLMQGFGPPALFAFIGTCHAALVGIGLWRLAVRPSPRAAAPALLPAPPAAAPVPAPRRNPADAA
jgi:MFS family permease